MLNEHFGQKTPTNVELKRRNGGLKFAVKKLSLCSMIGDRLKFIFQKLQKLSLEVSNPKFLRTFLSEKFSRESLPSNLRKFEFSVLMDTSHCTDSLTSVD